MCPIADTENNPNRGGKITSMTLSAIQRAIEDLPQEAQAQLASWVADRDGAAWDTEIERDFRAGGAGAVLLEHLKRQVRAGNSRPLTLRRFR
jgi:hypothetical protein